MSNVQTRTRIRVGVQLATMPDEELEKPYRVILLNDDVTPMDFVILVLEFIFELAFEESARVMLEAHHTGRAHVVTLPYEEARDRVYQAQHVAREAGYPLALVLEPDA